MKIKKTLKIKAKLSDSALQILSDSRVADKVKKIKVRIEATHSGKVNKNKFFYIPEGMKNGAESFIEPFNKPVLVNHDTYGPAIGRVLESRYVDYAGIGDNIKGTNNPLDLVDSIVDYVKSVANVKDYKGTGHIELIAEITDSEAIEKILDKRYLTVSISGNTTNAVCSICGNDIKNEDMAKDCDHFRGEVYDGEEAFLIAGDMSFDEVSFVNTPADVDATSEVVKDSVIKDSVRDNSDFTFGTVEIIDFEINTGESNLKKKLADLLKDKKLYDIIKGILAELGLSDFALTDERLEKLRKSSFLFAAEKAIPVNDKAHVLAAKKLAEQIEDSEELTQALELLDSKFTRLFGEGVSFEDALEQVKPSAEDNASNNADTAKESVEIDYDKLSDSVAEKLKSLLVVDKSYSSERAAALEEEVESLEQELEDLNKKFKSLVVDQVLAAEGRVEDSDYRAKLEARSIESLNDKLSDIRDTATNTPVADSAEGEESDEGEGEGEGEGITDTGVDLTDSAEGEGDLKDESEEGDDAGSLSDSTNAETVVLTVKEVQDEYKRLVKTKSITAASNYLKQLKDEGKLPNNFTFSKK